MLGHLPLEVKLQALLESFLLHLLSQDEVHIKMPQLYEFTGILFH